METYDRKHWNYTMARIEANTLYTDAKSAAQMVVDDLNFIDEDMFLLETPKNGNFVWKSSDD